MIISVLNIHIAMFFMVSLLALWIIDYPGASEVTLPVSKHNTSRILLKSHYICTFCIEVCSDSKIHVAHMGPTWVPYWPHEPCCQGLSENSTPCLIILFWKSSSYTDTEGRIPKHGHHWCSFVISYIFSVYSRALKVLWHRPQLAYMITNMSNNIIWQLKCTLETTVHVLSQVIDDVGTV